jgi:hypothetical protein
MNRRADSQTSEEQEATSSSRDGLGREDAQTPTISLIESELIVEEIGPMDSEYEGLETLLPDDTDSNRSRSQTRPEPIGQFLNSPRDLHVSAPSSSLSWDETNSHETNNQLEEAIRRAQALSIAHTDIKKIWKDLQESHQVAARRNNELLEFPYWVMREVPHRNIERIIDGIYDSDHYLTLYPIIMHAYEKKQEDAWVFYLFFGNIHQALAKAMVKVAQYLYLHKPTKIDSFDGLYRKVKQIRDRRIKKGTPRPGKNILGFLPQDFHSYRVFVEYYTLRIKSNSQCSQLYPTKVPSRW